MKRIFSKQSETNEDKLKDLLNNTIANGECLEWTRSLNTDGYPNMYGNVKVHRLVNMLYTGISNEGLVVRHTCDNKLCINPEHLITGTQRDNNQDMVDRGRYYRVITPDLILKVKALLSTDLFLQKEIAEMLNINPRRVSDIYNGLYMDDGKFIGRSEKP